MTFSEQARSATRLVDWYWQFGRLWDKQYAVSASGWLSHLESIRRAALTAARVSDRPCMAIWGPSAAGKSTLLSSYLDNDDPLGVGSPLHWDGGPPVRFVIKKDNPEAIALNPHNFGVDASSCVTRFVGAEEVANPASPVSVLLGTEAELELALAFGYISECRPELQGGKITYWTVSRVRELLEKFQSPPSSKAAPQKSLWLKAYDLCDCLDILVASSLPRYQNLRDENGRFSRELRREILENTGLLCEADNLNTLICTLLWDAREPITGIRKALLEYRKRLVEAWGDAPVYLTHEVTALLLDMAAYRNLCEQEKAVNSAKKQRLKESHSDKVRRAGWDRVGEKIVISIGGQRSLFSHTKDFGLFQGLVWELVVPVRLASVAPSSSPFREFLSRADLLDFPGVKRAHQSASDVLLDLDKLTADDDQKLLTEVLKRGKTACIVGTYAKGLGIDGFSVLARLGEPPAQPQQIATGLSLWCRELAPDYHLGNGPSPLPLNLVLTFCSNIVNKVASNPPREGGLRPVFEEMLGPLGSWADQRAVTTTLAINYAQFPDGKFTEPANRLAQAKLEIEADPYFSERFHSDASRKSFSEMLTNGGTDYVFRQFISQLRDSPRRQRLLELETRNSNSLSALVEQVRQPENQEDELLRKELNDWRRRLATRLDTLEDESAVALFSHALRRLFDVDYQQLEPVLDNLGERRHRVALAHVKEQFERWRSSRGDLASRGRNGWLHEVELSDERAVLRALAVFSQAVVHEDIVGWLLDRFGSLSSPDDCREARRFLALRMAKALLPEFPVCASQHPAAEVTAESLRAGWNSEEFRIDTSPHVTSFLNPLLAHLAKLADGNIFLSRQPQPGDAELRSIVSSSPENSHVA